MFLTPVGHEVNNLESSVVVQELELEIGTAIESKVRPTGVQLKRKAKLPAVIGLTTKQAVYWKTVMLWPIFFIMGTNFNELRRKIIRAFNLLQLLETTIFLLNSAYLQTLKTGPEVIDHTL